MPTGGANNYAQNNYKSYNKGFNNPTDRFFMNNNILSYPRNNIDPSYGAQYMSNHELTGGEASGSVWINKNYNVAKESPGISWIL